MRSLIITPVQEGPSGRAPPSPPSNNPVESLDDILFVEDRIGEGAFADVYKCKIDETRYAIKCMKKGALREVEKKQLLSEIRVLQTIDHPLMIKLHHVMQNGETIYLITDLLVWGDLFEYLSITTLTEKQVAFYTTNVVMMMEYLHSNEIVYRDLKSENLVLMGNGYLKLIDFGFAKMLKAKEKTYTILGTPGYIAPEIMMGRGYDHQVDWWALGVFAYELMFKCMPFGDDISQLVELSQQPLEFPNPEVSATCVDFIKSLLRYDHDKRLNKYSVKSQRWFVENDVNWIQLYAQGAPSAHIPSKKRFSSTYVKYGELSV